jgi:hypothetical protein
LKKASALLAARRITGRVEMQVGVVASLRERVDFPDLCTCIAWQGEHGERFR